MPISRRFLLKHITFNTIMKQNFAFLFLLISLFLIACEKTSPVKEASHFPPNVEKVFRTNCTNAGCHSGQESGEFDLTNWNTAFLGASGTGADIVPYNADWSHVFQHVNSFPELGLYVAEDDMMPPLPYNKLSREDVLTIQQWILEGAKSDKGEAYWAKQEASTHDKCFVLCSGSDLIAVIDIPTNKIMRFISVGVNPDKVESPHYIKVSPDGLYIYVTLIEGQAIEKYRTDNYAFVGRVEVAGQPSLLALNQDGSRLLTTHWNNDDQSPRVSLIDATNMVVLEVAVTDAPLAHGLASSSDFRTIYVTPNGGNFYVRYTLSADLNHFETEDRFPLNPSEPIPGASNKYYPYQAILDEANAKLYISCKNTHEVRVYNSNTNAFITAIAADSVPRLMALDSENKHLFVACANAQNSAEQGAIRGCIVVINTETMTVEKKIYGLGHRPHGLKIDKKHNYLFVSTENTGGIDPPHHPTQGAKYPPGKAVRVNLNSLNVVMHSHVDVASYPTSVEVVE